MSWQLSFSSSDPWLRYEGVKQSKGMPYVNMFVLKDESRALVSEGEPCTSFLIFQVSKSLSLKPHGFLS